MLWIRPFKRGDYITISEMGKGVGYTGEVLSIDYHYVTLLTDEGTKLMLPSYVVYGKVVEAAKRPAPAAPSSPPAPAGWGPGTTPASQ